MARLGIDYDRVSAAAFELVRSDQPVTVDNVRIQLGGTGSKSTIAPLLRRWKAENAAKGSTHALPQDVLRSVRRLYEDIEQQFTTERAVADAAASLRIHELTTQNQLLREQLETSERTCGALDRQFADAQSQLANLQQELSATRAELQQRQVRQELLEQHLAERTSEVADLHNQVTKTTRQFEHFQAASQQRWDDERRRHEIKLTEALHANERTREHLQQVRLHASTIQAELALSTSGHERLSVEHQHLQSEFDELRQQVARQEESIRRFELDAVQHANELAALKHSYEVAVKELAEAETHLAVSSSKEVMLQTSLAASEQRAEAARSEYMAQLHRYAELEVELRYCQRTLDDLK
jgi:chromosome segregation ATPase